MSLFFLLFLFSISVGNSLLFAQSASDERDMRVFTRDFMHAYNQQDHNALRKLYSGDAVRVDEDGEVIKGAVQIAAFFAEQFRLHAATLLILQQQLN